MSAPEPRIEHLDAAEATPQPPAEHRERPVRFRWQVNAALFAATVVSVFHVGAMWSGSEAQGLEYLLSGWIFAVPLLAILLAHEFGHYIAARIHGVPASLPYFLPLPVPPFGTLGAIILMPGRIRSRKALLDIGAAGPLAGMAVAIPVMLYGLSLSSVEARTASGYLQEGQSLLYLALKYVVFGPIRADQDVFLHPTALAAWAGFFVTFLNLLPYGQLDGGHVSYAVFGQRHNRVVSWFIAVPLLLSLYNAAVHAGPVVDILTGESRGPITADLAAPLISSTTSWLFLSILLLVMRRFSGARHPPVEDVALSRRRRAIGVVTLALFVLLFMPSPLVSY
jgi:membrane-associated protease RseP (regulator of RpoE activity)